MASPVLAGIGRQADHVLRAETRDRAFDGGRAAGAEAEFPREFGRDVLAWLAAHQLQRLHQAPVGHDIQERGLLQFHRESLPQRLVEHGFACRVPERRDDNPVPLGEGFHAARADEQSGSGSQSCRHDNRKGDGSELDASDRPGAAGDECVWRREDSGRGRELGETLARGAGRWSSAVGL